MAIPNTPSRAAEKTNIELDLFNWVTWPKNTFQNLFDGALAKGIEDSERRDKRLSDVEIEVLRQRAAELTDDLSGEIATHISRKAPFDRLSYLIGYRQEQASADILIRELWGPALDAARIQWFIARDTYAYVFQHHVSRCRAHKKAALNSLATRCLLVFNEILCLCENGFPDAALARWRTLHELHTVFLCLQKIGGKSYELFAACSEVNDLRLHEAIERRTRGRERVINEICKSIDKYKSIYSKKISNEFGWAEICLGKGKISFRELEIIAEHEHRRAAVRYASRYIHANRLDPDQSLGFPQWHGAAAPLVGPSPYGIRFALLEAVNALTLLTVDITAIKYTLDTIVLMKISHQNKMKFDKSLNLCEKMVNAYTRSINNDWKI